MIGSLSNHVASRIAPMIGKHVDGGRLGAETETLPLFGKLRYVALRWL